MHKRSDRPSVIAERFLTCLASAPFSSAGALSFLYQGFVLEEPVGVIENAVLNLCFHSFLVLLFFVFFLNCSEVQTLSFRPLCLPQLG